VKQVIRSETELVLALYRTQLFDPADIENVKKVQAGYKVEPLSAFLGRPAPGAAPAIAFPAPLTPEGQRTSIEFFGLLNFVLGFCPTHPSEAGLMERFARIGVGGGKSFDPGQLGPETRRAMEQGMADAWAEFGVLKGRVDAGELTSGDVFGTREFLKNNYLYRMAGAVLGIYGNSKEEAIYPAYTVDADGRRLDGAQRYTLRFGPGELPPVRAFWSLTMYRLPESLLVANPLDRYLLNSPMLPGFARDADGGITFHVQRESPGAEREANWLPAPAGPFVVFMRLYWPKPEALDGTWARPKMERVP
jgi:hypothetical protein